MKKNDEKKSFSFNIYAFFILLFLLIFVILFFGLKSYSSYSILSIQKINYTLNISDYVGLNLDSDKLHFGSAMPGSTSSRSLAVKTDFDGYVFVLSKNKDDLFVSNQGVRVGPGYDAYLDFEFVIPKDSSHKNIEDMIYFYIMKKDKKWPLLFQDGKLLETFVKVEDTPNIIINISND